MLLTLLILDCVLPCPVSAMYTNDPWKRVGSRVFNKRHPLGSVVLRPKLTHCPYDCNGDGEQA